MKAYLNTHDHTCNIKTNGLFDKHMKCITYIVYIYPIYVLNETGVLNINLMCGTYVICTIKAVKYIRTHI